MIDDAALLELTLDLSRSLASEDRSRRLVAALARVLGADAVCLLLTEGDSFVPAASYGLTADVAGRQFRRPEHPRLEAIAASENPVRFPLESRLPDPFDGLLERDSTGLATVHACLGIPLRLEGSFVGLLTADAVEPRAFSRLDERTLDFVGALTAATVRTSRLIEQLETKSQRMNLIAEDLSRSVATRGGGELIGKSAAMQRLREEIALVAPSNMTALITGETGVGKDLVARGIHRASARNHKPLIELNCAALPPSVAESELFGHVRGAFTGAERDRAGKLELADGGTLFLDEIGELPLSLQPKLLRALQQGEVQRVGSDRALRVDVRFVAATNRDLLFEVKAGRFREDLYHRLHVYRIEVPPLRERPEDISALAGHFCDEARHRLGVGPVRMTTEARRNLAARPWAGNVRELENTLQRAVLRASRGISRGEPVVVHGEDLDDVPTTLGAPEPRRATEGTTSFAERVEEYKAELVRGALERHPDSRAAAARSLGLDRSNFHHLLRRLGLDAASRRR